MENFTPKIAVLMAVKNGLPYLPEQVDSIFNQQNCQVTLFVSDDGSMDGSDVWLQQSAKKTDAIKLLPKAENLGSAAKNFYRLILAVETDSFDFIAFADQDDLWFPDKLIRHTELARKHKAEGVSSNAIAFWPDGQKYLLDKAHSQREFDYLFESAGPGCTYLMTPWLAGMMKQQLSNKNSPARDVDFHDWLAYALCRAYGRLWLIDQQPSLKYRQHSTNTYGVNVGIKAKWLRLKQLRQHWYRREILKIAKVCYIISSNPKLDKLIPLLENKSFLTSLKLFFYLNESRRKLSDRLLLAGTVLTGLF